MSHKKTLQSFGVWDSPITPGRLAQAGGFADLAWDTNGSLVWLENRPNQNALVVWPGDGQAWRDLNAEFSARGKLGYGGGDFSAGQGYIYFAEKSSARLYRQPVSSGVARPITPAFGAAAAPVPSPDGRWLLYVHSCDDQDVLALVDAEGRHWPQKLAEGDDFYMQPAWSPDSRSVAWISWRHPQMPWDGTRLYLARLNFPVGTLPTLAETHRISGDSETAILQPTFSPDGRSLAYISDRSGWWQLYLYDLDSQEHRQMTFEKAEHAQPAWTQGQRTYLFSPQGNYLYFLRFQQGTTTLWRLNLAANLEQQIQVGEEYAHLKQLSLSPDGRYLAVLGSGARIPERILLVPLADERLAVPRILRHSQPEDLPLSTYTAPETLAWNGEDGQTVFGLFYPPHNEDFEGNGLPPLLVYVHGGPTGQVSNGFNLEAQFFTSRGYAYLVVNYRGSSGYGRDYRQILHRNWGVYDVLDVISGAKFLSQAGRIDPQRRVIYGGSAGGFTVLKLMEDYPGFFRAGVCLYPVVNQFSLVNDTHKFERFYSDSLLGPLPEAAPIYHQRSPGIFADRIVDPLILFHGAEDPVVPLRQSEDLVQSLRRKGTPHLYHVYPNEGHGFRKPENIAHFYQTVEAFLREHVIYSHPNV